MSLKPVQHGDEVLRKGPWMPEEDEILVEYVRQFGARDWSSIRSKGLLPRTGKSCRLRWVNTLKPDLKRSGCKFSPEEEKLVVEMQAQLGNKWAKIASCLPGRTDNDVKNFWSTRQKRILRALQRPKMLSGSTDASADTSDLSKEPSLAGFGGFQVHSPSGGASLLGSAIGPNFIFAECDSGFREVATDIQRHMRGNVHSFNSLDVLSSDNLSEPSVPGEISFPTEKNIHLSTSTRMDTSETKPPPTNLHHSLTVSASLPIASRTTRSIKRRPRSRRDTRSTTFSCFDHPLLNPTLHSKLSTNNFLTSRQPQSTTNSTNSTNSVTMHENNCHDLELTFDLQQQLQSEGSLMQNAQMFGPEMNPLFLSNGHQWEKLPVMYSEDCGAVSEDCENSKVVIAIAETCSPDSVIGSFTADVFDSLEPLNSSPRNGGLSTNLPFSSSFWVIGFSLVFSGFL